jgi:hypothetical protein
MIYDLDTLLLKLGAPDVREKKALSWYYFDEAKKDLAGAAEIRLEAGGERLIAELKHIRANFEDDAGDIHSKHTDTVYFAAERTARPGHYRVTKLVFDGEDYENPRQSVIELALSIFHAKALEISMRMLDHAKMKQEILSTPGTEIATPQLRKFLTPPQEAQIPQQAAMGVVIPFRPREKPLRATA